MKYLRIIRNFIIAAGILTILFRNTLHFSLSYSFLWWLFVFLLFGITASAFEKLFELKYPRFKVIGMIIGFAIGGVILALIFGIPNI